MQKQEKRMLSFLLRYPVGWHSIGPDSRATVRRLADSGLVEWNAETKQARIAIDRQSFGLAEVQAAGLDQATDAQ